MVLARVSIEKVNETQCIFLFETISHAYVLLGGEDKSIFSNKT